MNRNRKTAWLGLAMVAAGACCLADLSATAAETPGSNASAAKAAAEHAPATGNLLRNAGFELDSVFNGSPMRQGTEFMRAVALFQKRCPPPPCEGWWIEGNAGDGVSLESKEVHSGSRAIADRAAGGRTSVAGLGARSTGPGRAACAECVGPHDRRQGVVGTAARGRGGPQRPSPAYAAVAIAPANWHCRRTPRSGAESR